MATGATSAFDTAGQKGSCALLAAPERGIRNPPFCYLRRHREGEKIRTDRDMLLIAGGHARM